MTPGELLARITAGNPPTILDVRSRREFARGHVPGAVHIPFWTIVNPWRRNPQPLLDKLARSASGAPDGQSLVVYCELGPRAWLAGALLGRRGFGRIEYLDGHMFRWRRECSMLKAQRSRTPE